MITPANRSRFEHQANNRFLFVAGIGIGVVVVAALAVGGIVLVPRFLNDATPTTEEGLAYSSDGIKSLWDHGEYRMVREMAAVRLGTNPFDPGALLYSGMSSFYVAISLQDAEERKQGLMQAIESLRRIPVLMPGRNNGDVWYVLGKAYYHLGYFYESEARDALSAADSAGYRAADLYEYLGLLSSSFSRYDEALEYFRKSLALEDRDILHLAMANTFQLMGKTTEAVRMLDELLAHTDDAVVREKCMLKKADILFASGDLEKAESAWKSVLDLNAQCADAYFYLGEIQSERGDPVKARALWRQAYMLDQTHAGAINRLSS